MILVSGYPVLLSIDHNIDVQCVCNFMESVFSEIAIWLNLCVSASNKLVKVWEEGSLGKPGRDKMGREKTALHKEEGEFLHMLKPSPRPSK